MRNYWRRLTGPIYNYFDRYDYPIGPVDVRFPELPPLLGWDGPQHSRENPFHEGLFNEYSANMDVASPAYVGEFVTVPQEYDEYDYYRPRAGPRSGYYARRYASNTASDKDEYLNPPKNEISEACEKTGSNLAELLAKYGLRGLLAGGLVAGTMYGGYKTYNWWKNRKPKIPVEAGVNVTSEELSNNNESKGRTNITLNPADAETRAKIRRLIR